MQNKIERLRHIGEQARELADEMADMVKEDRGWKGWVITHNILAGAQEAARTIERTLEAIERGPE